MKMDGTVYVKIFQLQNASCYIQKVYTVRFPRRNDYQKLYPPTVQGRLMPWEGKKVITLRHWANIRCKKKKKKSAKR